MAEYEVYWKNEYEYLWNESKNLIAESPEAKDVIQRVLKTLSDIVKIASCIPTKGGQSEEWFRIVNTAQKDRTKICEILRGKRLFSALFGVYCLTLATLKAVFQKQRVEREKLPKQNRPYSTEASADDTDGFQEKKRNITGEKSPPKSKTVTSVPTRNFTPLNSVGMDTEDRRGDETPKGTGRSPHHSNHQKQYHQGSERH